MARACHCQAARSRLSRRLAVVPSESSFAEDLEDSTGPKSTVPTTATPEYGDYGGRWLRQPRRKTQQQATIILGPRWIVNEDSPGAFPAEQHQHHHSGPVKASQSLDAGHAHMPQQLTRARPPLEVAVPRVPLLGIGQGG